MRLAQVLYSAFSARQSVVLRQACKSSLDKRPAMHSLTYLVIIRQATSVYQSLQCTNAFHFYTRRQPRQSLPFGDKRDSRGNALTVHPPNSHRLPHIFSKDARIANLTLPQSRTNRKKTLPLVANKSFEILKFKIKFRRA